jgi:hypothetical protein
MPSNNPCARRVSPEHAYEVYATLDFSWVFYVLKKYQSPAGEAKNPYARWYCATSSPLTYGELEFGDIYAADIKRDAQLIFNPLRPIAEQMDAYQGEPPAFWKGTFLLGDGYDVMEAAEGFGWHAVSSWGKDGWDLGSWPLVIVFVRNTAGKFHVIEYVEGDVTMWSCPSQLMRQQIIDSLAFFHWKHREMPWVKDFESIDTVPLDAAIRGSYSSKRE